MASGFMQRFQGRIKANQLWVGSGGFIDASSGIKGLTDYIIKLPLPVTATANTDFTVSLPPGGTLLNASVYTSVAYTGNTVTIALGVSAGDATYVTATTIKAIGVYPLTLLQPAAAGPAIMPATSPNLFIRVIQTATTTNVGTAFLVLNYTAS
jgi:hypothetical protein